MTLPQALRHEAFTPLGLIKLRPLPHALLTLLLLRRPEDFVGLDDIVEALWPDPDKQPLATSDCIHFYVMQLRRAGVSIEVRRGQGWRIPRRSRETAQKQAA